jgi:hypothetical protein
MGSISVLLVQMAGGVRGSALRVQTPVFLLMVSAQTGAFQQRRRHRAICIVRRVRVVGRDKQCSQICKWPGSKFASYLQPYHLYILLLQGAGF